MIKILIDNGHGIDTLGKRSPDGRLREYAWAREIATMLEEKLKSHGYDAQCIVTEETDIPLKERVRRINDICRKHGSQNCLLVSIHLNAAGADGKWHSARGWSGWVSRNASSKSKHFAQMLFDEANKRNLCGNRSIPTEHYWTENWYICKKSNCPSVLTENLFQDNKDDVMFLETEQGKQAITNLHFDAIVSYINTYNR